ncbi:hypothetical protein [Syntrophomonas erecta]
MSFQKGQIISKKSFMENGDYAKEEYEGLIVSADSQKGHYNIGVQLDEERVLLVDHARDSEVHQRVNQLAPQIQEIQRQYKSGQDLQNYTGI